ncbi:MAG: 1,2-phenylacetyl-CoA epoxidase subunit PaaD [Burkholderiales bacterium]
MTTAEQRALEDAAGHGAGRVDADAIRRALDALPDPEIPVVSIVELGIVREIVREADGWVVRLTPTYSGCPATESIVDSVREALRTLGASARVEIVLAPAWTTDWIAPAAHEKLRAYGIAPPGCARSGVSVVDVRGISPLRRDGVVVPCPRCGSQRTSLTAQFGSTACKALYRCEDCREPFDYFKPH